MQLRRNALLGLASPFDIAQDDRLCYSVEIVLTKSEHLLIFEPFRILTGTIYR